MQLRINLCKCFRLDKKNDVDSDDDGYEDEDIDSPRSQKLTDRTPSDITCYLATVDGELYGRCSPDGKFVYLFVSAVVKIN